MFRSILEEGRIHPTIREKVATYRTEMVKEVEAAIAANAVVVVGMRQNPFPRRARRMLDAAGIAYAYLEYGGYFSESMVFVKGVLVGGAQDLEKFLEAGGLKK